MECRLSKVKCSGGDLCTRCKRLGKECYYKSHKRGRKSDSSKIQKLERTVDSLSRALEQFSKSKVAGSSHPQAKEESSETKAGVRGQAADNDDGASPVAFWKGTDAPKAQLPAASSSSTTAMSPPAQSPRPPQSSTYRDHVSHLHRRPSEVYRQRSTSATYQQTPQSITSATPTSDDPDEPENLGLPTLSNPLKLLAHASDSARDRDSGLESSDPRSKAATDQDASNKTSASEDAANAKGSAANIANGEGSSSNIPASAPKGEPYYHRDGRPTLFGVSSIGTATNTVSRFGPGRGKAFFDVGLFTMKLDNLPHFDPIDRGYLTLAEAESLYAVFMQYINPALTLLDPHLHTFDYVRSCSALLLSSTCWIAAKYRVEASQIAADLEMHIRSNLLPTILMEGFRNAEIPQALIILAAYHPQMNTLSEDKAWAYVGFAIRIASELDMNSRIAVRPANRQDDAGLARRLRNRERTWLNLWLFETSMSQHMGRRPTLANDPVVMGCARWHLDKFALHGDKAMVAVVQLRLLMLRNIELFENFVDVSVTHMPAERTAKQVELFRRICASDLDTWLATWTGPSHHLPSHDTVPVSSDTPATGAPSETGSTSSSKSKLWPNTDLPPTLSRVRRLKLYYWYARLILDTIALKCSHLGLSVLRPVYKDAYACCMAYLGLFVATMVPNGLFWGHNSTVVTPAYCAIFALRIVGLTSTNGGGLQVKGKPEEEEGLGIDIDAEYTFEMVEKVAKVCEEAGRATPHRRGAAGSYAFFLFTVLAKAKSAWRPKAAKNQEGEQEAPAAVGSKKREREGDVAVGPKSKSARNGKGGGKELENGKVSMPGSKAGHEQRNGVQQGASSAATATGRANNAVLATVGVSGGEDADSDHHFLRQLMQFQAGPSGVQTAIVPSTNSSSTPLIPSQQTFFPDTPAGSHAAAPTNFASGPVDNVAGQTPLGAAGGATNAGGIGMAGVGGVAGDAGMEVDIDWDFGMLDGFLGESLFSDMSFISTAAPAPPAANGGSVTNFA